jgi:hypothetical protein
MRRAKLEQNVSPEVLHGLGRIVVEFNLVEFTLGVGIQVTGCTDQRIGAIIVAEMSLRAKTDVLFSILRHLHADPEQIATFDELRKRVLSAEEERNRVVHSYYAPSELLESAKQSKPSAKGKRGYLLMQNDVSATDLNAIAGKFHELAEDLLSFLVQKTTKWTWSGKGLAG